MKAFVVLREGKTLGDDEVKGYVRDNLARYKTPREIVFIGGGRVEGSPLFGPPFASYQAEIFLRGLAGETPEHPIPGRWRTSSAAPGPKTRCAPTRRRSGAGGSSHGCSGTSPSATSRVGDGGQHRVGQPAREIAAAAPGANWFQLYGPNDRELAASMLARAEKAGYGAVIVTLDTFLPGWKPRDLQGAWQPSEFVVQFSNPRLTWEDLEFLRARTSLPIALKGILHADDARAAREHGIDAVVVSNLGGRQVDGAIARLDALPAIADAVGGELGVLLDSGVRSGADVFKALALGADAVLLGRPYLRGFAAGGERGVLSVLRAILAELDLTIGLSGHARPAELGVGALVRGC